MLCFRSPLNSVAHLRERMPIRWNQLDIMEVIYNAKKVEQINGYLFIDTYS